MSTSEYKNRIYRPHESVLNHPDMIGASVLRSLVVERTLSSVISMVRIWKTIEDSDTFQSISLNRAVEWDLITHYGITPEELEPGWGGGNE